MHYPQVVHKRPEEHTTLVSPYFMVNLSCAIDKFWNTHFLEKQNPTFRPLSETVDRVGNLGFHHEAIDSSGKKRFHQSRVARFQVLFQGSGLFRGLQRPCCGDMLVNAAFRMVW